MSYKRKKVTSRNTVEYIWKMMIMWNWKCKLEYPLIKILPRNYNAVGAKEDSCKGYSVASQESYW